MYATFGQKPAYTEKAVVKSKTMPNQQRGVSMDKHTIKCDIEIGRNQEQVNNIKPIVPTNPK